MGNRAIITTPERRIGLYVHSNGGRDTIEPLLRYCELKGYRPPSVDDYGWARLCQVLGNFFGGTLSVGIDSYTNDDAMDPGDNGIYVIDGWRIVDRISTNGKRIVEQTEHDFDEMLRAFDEAMPERERLGAYLDSEEIPVKDVVLGDYIWMRGFDGRVSAYEVIGFGTGIVNGEDRSGVPFVRRFVCDGDCSSNPNNYPSGDTCRIIPRD